MTFFVENLVKTLTVIALEKHIAFSGLNVFVLAVYTQGILNFNKVQKI